MSNGGARSALHGYREVLPRGFRLLQGLVAAVWLAFFWAFVKEFNLSYHHRYL